MPSRSTLPIAPALPIAWRTALSLFACSLFACSSGPDAASRKATPRPALSDSTNLVLVIVDTLRADKIGCYGSLVGVSPELDAMAEQGVRFEHTIAQCSWTRPSIGSMLTGIYPRTLGLYDEGKERLPDRFETLAEIFGKRGYTTIGATANPHINVVFGFSQGFDHYLDSKRGLPGMDGGPRQNRGRKKRERGFGHWTAPEIFRFALDAIGPDPAPPYYVQLNIMEMHDPEKSVREEYRGLFSEVKDARTRRYLRALRQVSADLGEFIEEFASRPGLDDTLFVISSDHGEGLDDHPGIFGGYFHGFLLYESHARVPLILYHPKGAIGHAVVERPVRNMDLAPTLLDLFGFDIPGGMDGVSVRALIEDPRAEVALPEYFVTETDFRIAEKIGVYSKQWKYFENRDHWARMNPRELQPVGVTEDGAANDRIASRPEVADTLDAFLESWELAHPKSEPTLPDREISEEEKQLLEELGYAP